MAMQQFLKNARKTSKKALKDDVKSTGDKSGESQC